MPAATRKATIVLGGFENKTGDPVFDGILRDGLSVQLQQSRFLTLISDQQVQQALRFMNRLLASIQPVSIGEQPRRRSTIGVDRHASRVARRSS
jgi:hypothetical protein